jgi:hypothetical protein
VVTVRNPRLFGASRAASMRRTPFCGLSTLGDGDARRICCSAREPGQSTDEYSALSRR